MTTKHFNWTLAGDSPARGRIATLLDGDQFTVRQIAGQAPPMQIIAALMLQDDRELLKASIRLHHTRQFPIRVDVRTGMSGCGDALLRSLLDTSLISAPIQARLHESMAGKLNEGWSGWLGDLYPLANALKATKWDESLTVEEVDPPSVDGFAMPQTERIASEKRLLTATNSLSVSLIRDAETRVILAVEVGCRTLKIGEPFKAAELEDYETWKRAQALAVDFNLEIRADGASWILREGEVYDD